MARRDTEDLGSLLRRCHGATDLFTQLDHLTHEREVRRTACVAGVVLEANPKVTASFNGGTRHSGVDKVTTDDGAEPRQRALFDLEHLKVGVEGLDGGRQAEGHALAASDDPIRSAEVELDEAARRQATEPPVGDDIAQESRLEQREVQCQTVPGALVDGVVHVSKGVGVDRTVDAGRAVGFCEAKQDRAGINEADTQQSGLCQVIDVAELRGDALARTDRRQHQGMVVMGDPLGEDLFILPRWSWRRRRCEPAGGCE